MNTVSSSLRGKQVVIFVAYDKTQAFEHEEEPWEIYVCHHEPDSVCHLEAADEISGDGHQCDFFGI